MVGYWEVIIYVTLLSGAEYTQKLSMPMFSDEEMCNIFIKLPQFEAKLIEIFWTGTGVKYVIPKCIEVVQA